MNRTRLLIVAAALAVLVGIVYVATRSNVSTAPASDTALDSINGFQSAPPTQDATLAGPNTVPTTGDDYNGAAPAAGPATDTSLTADPLESATMTPPTNAANTVTSTGQLPNPPQPTTGQ